MKTTTSILDVKYEFLQEWQPYDVISKKVEKAILRHFMNRSYTYQPTHEESSKKPFNVYSFNQLSNVLGFAYTSTGSYAGLWICNGGYLYADKTHHFEGFAVTIDGKIIGIAQDAEENEIYINIGSI